MVKKRYIAVACAAIVVSMPLSAAASNTPARRAVEADIARLAKDAGGEVGVFARHTESGLTLSLASDVRFPMASTFKVAVAGAILAKVDAGSLTLAQLVPIDPERVLMSEGIAEIFPFEGISVSVHNLIETMLTRSDNTATNVLTALAGGPAAVTDWVRTQGVQDMRVDGDTNDIVRRFFDIPPGPVPLNEQLKSLVIESLLHAVRGAAFAVPSALGAQEGALVLLCAAFGIPPEEAIALSLVKRAADLVLGVPGLIGWQMLEWGRLMPTYREQPVRESVDPRSRSH